MARRGRRKGRPIHGWLALDKPRGLTSSRVVEEVRRITGAAKAGHAGTLDPLATGVLAVAFGEATKTVAHVMAASKHYRFTLRFGEERDTDDAEGAVTATSALRPTAAEIEAALPAFVGEVEQVPPAYAAVKVDGERAYDLARRGEAVALAPRRVRIDELRLLAMPDPDRAEFEMVCGQGAYVRAVARDLGRGLGCLAHVEALRRTRVGPFRSEDAVSLEALARLVEDDALPQALVSMAAALDDLPAFALTEPQATRLRAGQRVRIAPGLITGGGGGQHPGAEPGVVRATAAGRLVALARLEDAELCPLRVFNP
ncbi:MAG TPA: tRNA pseudouridine(55) synthase TruB [Geminicoccaceae bacterium]|nr:tRNA pseudouridine(55) synthase TruB [Geminicoccaceae bacterium]